MTEKIARSKGYSNTISAGGTVNALKNLIISSDQIDEKSKIASKIKQRFNFKSKKNVTKELTKWKMNY